MRGYLVFPAFLMMLLPAFAGGTDLDRLFQSLKTAGAPEEAQPVEDRILTKLRQSGSPSIDLLMNRAGAAYAAGDKDVAGKLLASVTSLAPNFAEGWHERAILQADAGDDKGAIASLQKTLQLNGRHFVAMVRLGDLLEEYGDKDAALKLFRKALAIDPQFDGLKRRVEALSRKVEGQGI